MRKQKSRSVIKKTLHINGEFFLNMIILTDLKDRKEKQKNWYKLIRHNFATGFNFVSFSSKLQLTRKTSKQSSLETRTRLFGA